MQLPWVTLPEDKRAEYWSNAINNVGDTLVSAAQESQKRKKEAADLLLKQREADRMDANSAAERDNLKSLMAQREGETNRNAIADHLAATKEIMAALDAGQTDRAHAIATAYRTPLTQAPPTPGVAEEGPQATPEIAQQAGKIRAEQASFEPGDTAGPDSQYTGAAKAEMNRFAGAQNPPSTPGAYSIGGASYDPAQTAAAEESKRAEEAKRAKEAFAPVGYGEQAAAIATTGAKPGEIGSLVTGMEKADSAAKARAKQEEEARLFREQQAAQYRLTAEDQRRHQGVTEAQGWQNAGSRSAMAHSGGNPTADEAVARYIADNPGDQAGAVKIAAYLKAEDPAKLVTTLGKQPARQESNQVMDPATGKVAGEAVSPGAATKVANQIQANTDLVARLHEYKDSLVNDSAIDVANPYSDASKRRSAAYNAVLSANRTANKLGVGKYNIELDKGQLGGSGAGLLGALKPTSSPEQVQRMIDEQERHAQETVRAQLRGGARVGPEREKTVGEKLTGAAQKKPDSGGSGMFTDEEKAALQKLF